MHLYVDTLLGQDVQFRQVILPRSDSFDGSAEARKSKLLTRPSLSSGYPLTDDQISHFAESIDKCIVRFKEQ